MKKNFSVPDSLSRAVDILKENAGYLILTPLVYSVANQILGSTGMKSVTEAYMTALPQVLNGSIDMQEFAAQVAEAEQEVALGGMFWVGISLTVLLSIFYQVGYNRFQLQAIDGEKLDANSFITRFDTYVQYFLTSLLTGIIIAVGLLLFVLPGIYFAIRLWLAPYYVVDHGMSCTKAIKACWRDASGNWWNLFVSFCLLMLVALGGVLLCCIGSLFTAPLVGVATALIYRDICTGNEVVAEQQDTYCRE